MTHYRKLMALAGLSLSWAVATPVLAGTAPRTRLVTCGAQSCVLVTGRRESAETPVMINGHVVTVEGDRKWRAKLPVETVKQWSAPYARKIMISYGDEMSAPDSLQHAALPIGLLGHVPDLASLVITVH